MASPKVLSAQAKVTAVGRPTATSCAKVGPDRTAMGAPGWTLAATSDINLCEPASIPLEQSMSGRLPTGALPRIAPRCCAGVTTRTASQTARSSRLVVALIAGFRSLQSRKTRRSEEHTYDIKLIKHRAYAVFIL